MISPETIALVRDRTDIVAVVTEAVPSLKRKGRTFVALCPFHKEKSPSFTVNPDRGFFHCFGCKESGSAIDFVMKTEGYTFPEAIRALAERAGIVVEESTSPEQISEADRLKRAKEDLYAVNALAATYFEEQLRKHEHRGLAMDELEKRGLMPGRDAEVDQALQAFRIGYAPAGWDGLTNFLKAQSFSPIAAQTVGLLVPRSGGSGFYDRFRNRLMFSVMDAQGRVVAFSGRMLADPPGTEVPTEKPAKYINSPESPIYTKGQMLYGIHQARHSIRQEETAILVEGNFDVLSLHARGVTNVVGILGTAFTLEQAKLLRRFAPSLVFLLDGDLAGRKAVRASRPAIREVGLAARVADLPDGVDPDELVRTKGPEGIKNLVASAKGLLEALLEMALDERFVSADAFERAQRVEHVSKILAEEDNPLIRSMAKSYADQLAGRLDLVRSPEAFRALENSVKAALVKADQIRRAEQAKLDAQRQIDHPIEEKGNGRGERTAIVGVLIEWPVLLDDPEVQAELSHLEGPGVQVVSAFVDRGNPWRNTSTRTVFSIRSLLLFDRSPPAASPTRRMTTKTRRRNTCSTTQTS